MLRCDNGSSNDFKSIKWRLQIWYGLIFVVVLAGFGFTAYQLERNQQFGRIDNELHQRVGVLANSLRRPPLAPAERAGPPFDRPPPASFPTTARRDKIRARRVNFICRRKMRIYLTPTIQIDFYYNINSDAMARNCKFDNQPTELSKWRLAIR